GAWRPALVGRPARRVSGMAALPVGRGGVGQLANRMDVGLPSGPDQRAGTAPAPIGRLVSVTRGQGATSVPYAIRHAAYVVALRSGPRPARTAPEPTARRQWPEAR